MASRPLHILHVIDTNALYSTLAPCDVVWLGVCIAIRPKDRPAFSAVCGCNTGPWHVQP